MQIFILASVALAALTSVQAAQPSNFHRHMRVLEEEECTIENESQCDGNHWSGSTCCKDPAYECRWDDNQSVSRCQKKSKDVYADIWAVCTNKEDTCDPETSVCVYQSATYARCLPKELPSGTMCGQSAGGFDWVYDHCPSDETCTDLGGVSLCTKTPTPPPTTYVNDWDDCTGPYKECKIESSACVYHSRGYAQCKPAVLPSGSLCGQKDGSIDWLYDQCPSGETCDFYGKDYRCTKEETCSENNSQCGGRNWSGTSCCKDPEYECRYEKDSFILMSCLPKVVEEPSYVAVWGDCTKKSDSCDPKSSVCVSHSQYYAQCKPLVLPPGSLCGQSKDGMNWLYDECTNGEVCKNFGGDLRCSK